jgi:hypothetical protein
MFREYADEAIKQGKVFTEVAKETLEEVASETMKSKFNKQNAAEALKATTEYATQAGEMLQEKVPEAFEGMEQ